MSMLITCCEQSARTGTSAVKNTGPYPILALSSCGSFAILHAGLPMTYQMPNRHG